jgi:hypothetical protein
VPEPQSGYRRVGSVSWRVRARRGCRLPPGHRRARSEVLGSAAPETWRAVPHCLVPVHSWRCRIAVQTGRSSGARSRRSRSHGQAVPPTPAAREQHPKAFNTEKVRGPRSATGVCACTACGRHRRRTPALRRRALKAEAPYLPRTTLTLAQARSRAAIAGLGPVIPALLGVGDRSRGWSAKRHVPGRPFGPNWTEGHGDRRGTGAALVARSAPTRGPWRMRPASAVASGRPLESAKTVDWSAPRCCASPATLPATMSTR